MTVAELEKIWDKKSKTYVRFNNKLSSLQEQIFNDLKGLGIDFYDKTLVDIGCGTGIYSLYLSKFVKNILAIDISSKMLEILQNQANQMHINNIKTIHCNFDDFQSNFKFDIAILSMSQAVSDFNKFNNIAKTKIYINWAKPRQSSLIGQFIQKQNFKTSVDKLQSWLRMHDIKFNRFDYVENRQCTRSIKEALENIMWHLEINGLNLDLTSVKSKLQKLYGDGCIVDKINSEISMLVY